MPDYESLLLGGKAKRKTKAQKQAEAEMEEKKEMSGGKMTYEERCKNLAKARAVRASNLKSKGKAVKGKGNYTQDYVDESQVNYAGSPLDLYYRNTEEQQKKQREVRGEVAGRGMESPSESEEEEMIEESTGGRMRKSKKAVKGKGRGKDKDEGMAFMKHSMHTGLDMPTEAQFKRGGAVKKPAKEAGKKVDMDGAIQTLAMLASKFGLKLM